MVSKYWVFGLCVAKLVNGLFRILLHFKKEEKKKTKEMIIPNQATDLGLNDLISKRYRLHDINKAVITFYLISLRGKLIECNIINLV